MGPIERLFRELQLIFLQEAKQILVQRLLYRVATVLSVELLAKRDDAFQVTFIKLKILLRAVGRGGSLYGLLDDLVLNQ